MSRIASHLRAAGSAQGRKALIPYVTAGFPYRRRHAGADARAWSTAGADVIELGVPFSDPMADGPVIQKAGETRAGRAASAWPQVLAMVRALPRARQRTRRWC